MNMAPRQRLPRFLFSLITLSFLIASTAPSARAYDDDTHFWLTYYLARKVGFTPTQARQIASADVSVDYDHDTWPVLPFDLHLEDQRKRFHALPSTKETEKCRDKVRKELGLPAKSLFSLDKPRLTLAQRKQLEAGVYQCIKPAMDREEVERWAEAIDTGNPGVFLHYFQDKFAHRGFESQFGHLRAARVPDFLSSDPAKAKLMAQGTIQQLRRFMTTTWAGKRLPPEPNWRSVEVVVNDFIAANASRVLINDIYEPWDWDSNDVSICKVYGGEDCKDGETKPNDVFRLLRKFDDQQPPDSYKAYRIVDREFPGEVTGIWMFELEANALPGKKVTARTFWYDSGGKLGPAPNAKPEVRVWRLSE